MVISLGDRLNVAALGETDRDPSMREAAGHAGDAATNADVLDLPVQDQHHTLRFIAPDDANGRITIQIVDERLGRVVRQISWDVATVGKTPGSLFNYSI